MGPEGLEGEQEAMGGVERDWKCEINVEGVGYNGNSGRKSGTMSGTCCESKRFETRPLAGYQTGQHEQRRDMMDGAPRPPIPPHKHHRQPHKHPNPPRR